MRVHLWPFPTNYTLVLENIEGIENAIPWPFTHPPGWQPYRSSP
jgi:hypothetical protein